MWQGASWEMCEEKKTIYWSWFDYVHIFRHSYGSHLTMFVHFISRMLFIHLVVTASLRIMARLFIQNQIIWSAKSKKNETRWGGVVWDWMCWLEFNLQYGATYDGKQVQDKEPRYVEPCLRPLKGTLHWAPLAGLLPGHWTFMRFMTGELWIWPVHSPNAQKCWWDPSAVQQLPCVDSSMCLTHLDRSWWMRSASAPIITEGWHPMFLQIHKNTNFYVSFDLWFLSNYITKIGIKPRHQSQLYM